MRTELNTDTARLDTTRAWQWKVGKMKKSNNPNSLLNHIFQCFKIIITVRRIPQERGNMNNSTWEMPFIIILQSLFDFFKGMCHGIMQSRVRRQCRHNLYLNSNMICSLHLIRGFIKERGRIMSNISNCLNINVPDINTNMLSCNQSMMSLPETPGLCLMIKLYWTEDKYPDRQCDSVRVQSSVGPVRMGQCWAGHCLVWSVHWDCGLYCTVMVGAPGETGLVNWPGADLTWTLTELSSLVERRV